MFEIFELHVNSTKHCTVPEGCRVVITRKGNVFSIVTLSRGYQIFWLIVN